MQEPSALGRIVELVRDLRARCPWDAAQTPESLRPYFVEEAMELDHALGVGQDPAIRAELGDLLLHLAFQIVLAEERGAFGAEDLTRAVEAKMWARHPHLFPVSPRAPTAPQRDGIDLAGRGAADRTDTSIPAGHDGWERRKLKEREGASVLDGLPPVMPALVMAYRLQEKAAGVGFDWPDVTGPLAKVKEETAEVERELERQQEPTGPRGRVAEEIGDLLFAVVNLARKAGCDPRASLERANARFTERFRAVEALATERGIDLGTAGLAVLDGLWDEVKAAAD